MERKLLYVLLDTIKETCEKRRICKGCIFYDINYGCLLDARPDIWDTDMIKKNIDTQEEV